jgi:hypothetical protein
LGEYIVRCTGSINSQSPGIAIAGKQLCSCIVDRGVRPRAGPRRRREKTASDCVLLTVLLRRMPVYIAAYVALIGARRTDVRWRGFSLIGLEPKFRPPRKGDRVSGWYVLSNMYEIAWLLVGGAVVGTGVSRGWVFCFSSLLLLLCAIRMCFR